MTRAGRFVRNLLERLLSKYHEGYDPPPRVGEEVRIFRALHPDATIDEWAAYAERHAESAWRDAYVRGWEHAERVWPGLPPCTVSPKLVKPERYASAQRPQPICPIRKPSHG